MDSEAMSSKPTHPLLALMLGTAGLCLWGPLLFLWLISSGHGDYSAAVAILGLAMVACPMGAIMLIIYAVLDRPWTRPFRRAWFFWLQVLAIVVIGMSLASVFFHEWQDRRQQASTKEEAERAKEPERLMQAALFHDDDTSFAKAYKICGIYCSLQPWLRKAIAAHAPRIVGVLLEGLTKQRYDDGLDRAETMGICKDGAYYEGYFSLAGQAGASGNMVVIERFLPLWGRDQVQEAFDGAAFGNHVDTMHALLAYGADPHQPMDEHLVGQVAFDSVITSAMRSGSVDALRWLGEQGVRVSSDNEQDHIWTLFEDWVEHSPKAVWTGQLDAMLDALAKLGTVPAHSPLWHATRAGDALLAHALLRHGAVAENVDDDNMQATLQALLKGPPDQLGSDDGTRVNLCPDDPAAD